MFLSKTSCSVREAIHKWAHTVCFHLYKISLQVKIDIWWQKPWRAWGRRTAKGLKGHFWGERNVLYIISGTYNFQTLMHEMLKICAFYCMLITSQWNKNKITVFNLKMKKNIDFLRFQCLLHLQNTVLDNNGTG